MDLGVYGPSMHVHSVHLLLDASQDRLATQLDHQVEEIGLSCRSQVYLGLSYADRHDLARILHLWGIAMRKLMREKGVCGCAYYSQIEENMFIENGDTRYFAELRLDAGGEWERRAASEQSGR